MKTVFVVLISIIPLMGYAQVNCTNTESVDAAYHRYAQLAMEPIMKNGELVGYLLKETTQIQKAEALECLKASVRMGGWKAARTLANLYLITHKPQPFSRSDKASVVYATQQRAIAQSFLED